ncbi:MAG: hypothetical protein CMJ14_04525 [Pelagibacterales bacterium]|nr:hypothetical protein [Pelagibacterales bacterium]|tara:strand:- start:1236 stop:1850 length:615 start_codon:yes stop_codon:yes gene_type:complete
MSDEDIYGAGDGQSGTVFRDTIMLALAGFVSLVVLLLPFINPPAETESTKSDPPGNVIIEVFWPEDRDVDVDLWVQAPEDIPVGYSNRGGLFFNLLRDDLGIYKDPTPINYEVAYSRGINPGEHIVNLHLYREDLAAFQPFEAQVVVTVVNPDTKIRQQILESKVLLDEIGKELTIFRFELDETGNLNKNTINNEFVQLRSGSK